MCDGFFKVLSLKSSPSAAQDRPVGGVEPTIMLSRMQRKLRCLLHWVKDTRSSIICAYLVIWLQLLWHPYLRSKSLERSSATTSTCNSTLRLQPLEVHQSNTMTATRSMAYRSVARLRCEACDVNDWWFILEQPQKWDAT